MKATDAYRKINNSPIKGIVLYYTEQILKMDKVALGSVIAQIQTGKTPPKANPKYYSSSDVNWFKPSDIGYEKYLEVAGEKFSNIAITEKKATIYPKDTLLLIGIGGGVGRVSILKEEGSSNQQITGITFNEKVCAQYAYYYYLVREDYIKSRAKSMSFPILNQSRIKELEFRYPSVTEQNEFVKFIDACWYSFLNNEIPDISSFEISPELKEYALKQFKAIELDDNIQKNIENELTLLSNLKQSILQEAIQGKLTADWREQNQNTEPVNELLKRIKAEKDQLIKDKKIKKEKTLPDITVDDIPFDLPNNWVWCKIPQVLALTKDPLRRGPFGSSLKKDMFEPKGNDTTKVYEQQNAIKKHYSLGEYYISTKKHPNLNSFLAGPGDILISCAGTIGETYKLPEEAPIGIINQALLKIRLNNSVILDDFFLMMFKSQLKGQVNSDAKGSAMKNMGSVKYLKNELIFGLPPYEEQLVIIEKVKSLMQKSTVLEEEIKTSEVNAQMLMQAVLKEAFEGKKEEVVIKI